MRGNVMVGLGEKQPSEPVEHPAVQSLGAFLDAQPFNRRHAVVVGTCGVAFLFDAMDFQIMALVAPAIAREGSVSV